MTTHYEPVSNIDEEYLNSLTTTESFQGVCDTYHVNYGRLPFAEMDYYMARQFFVRHVCKNGVSATDAFKMISLKSGNERMWVSDLVWEGGVDFL